jgi:hypothetical protein
MSQMHDQRRQLKRGALGVDESVAAIEENARQEIETRSLQDALAAEESQEERRATW